MTTPAIPSGYAVRRGPDLEVPTLERITLVSPTGLEVAFVPEAGMVATSMLVGGVEVLARRNGLPAYLDHGSTFGIPLLAPWANRLASPHQHLGEVHWEVHPGDVGVHLDEHEQPIHGLLAGAKEWVVEELAVSADKALLRSRLRFDGSLDRFASFPFAHDLVVEAEVWDDTLTLRTSLTATGDHAVPVAFGWHPWFEFPATPRQEWELDLPFVRRATLNEVNIPTGEVRDEPIPVGPLGEDFYDTVFVDVPVGSVAHVTAGEYSVSVTYITGYPVAVVFAPLTHEVICIEPMSAPTDPFSGRFPVRWAEPGETATAVFDLTVRRTTTP